MLHFSVYPAPPYLGSCRSLLSLVWQKISHRIIVCVPFAASAFPTKMQRQQQKFKLALDIVRSLLTVSFTESPASTSVYLQIIRKLFLNAPPRVCGPYCHSDMKSNCLGALTPWEIILRKHIISHMFRISTPTIQPTSTKRKWHHKVTPPKSSAKNHTVYHQFHHP